MARTHRSTPSPSRTLLELAHKSRAAHLRRQGPLTGDRWPIVASAQPHRGSFPFSLRRTVTVRSTGVSTSRRVPSGQRTSSRTASLWSPRPKCRVRSFWLPWPGGALDLAGQRLVAELQPHLRPDGRAVHLARRPRGGPSASGSLPPGLRNSLPPVIRSSWPSLSKSAQAAW